MATRTTESTRRQASRPPPVGIRGCWELVLKLIIGLVLVAAYLLAWRRLERVGPASWIFLLVLLLLLLWLIVIQGHLVRLRCELLQPAGCKRGDPDILAGRVLERITGTAGGLGFGHYELEVLYAGAPIPAAVVYANAAGVPDPSATQGNHQVSGGTLGFVDIKAAALGAGAGFVTSTSFQVRMRVLGAGGASHTCTVSFQVDSARCVIKSVGAAWVHDSLNVAEPLCAVAPSLPPATHAIVPASVDGSLSVRGAANVYGCTSAEVWKVHLWAIPDATFAQPDNGDPVPTPGGVPLAQVEFTTAAQRSNNPISGLTNAGDVLAFAPGWGTRPDWVSFDSVIWPIDVPDLVEQFWTPTESGRYTLLLAVEDTAGNTYYDVQRVWVDHEPITGRIISIGGLAPCEDLRLSRFAGARCAIRGLAWDPPIDPALPQAAPNDNFAGYSLSFQKNGGGGDAIAVATPGVRVPNEWPALVSPDGLLADWDIIAALDGGSGPQPPPPWKLGRGERCAYVIVLNVSDTTLVGDGGSNHGIPPHEYAINIINDL